MASKSRRQRRAYEMYLKKYDRQKYYEWKSKVQERGKALFETNREAVEKSEQEFYEGMQTRLIDTLRSKGFEDSTIDTYIEDWVQTIKAWGSSEKSPSISEIRRNKVESTDESHD
jgi:hypothetical protein